MKTALDTIEATAQALAAQHYVADRTLATSVFLAIDLEKPLFLEGEPGVGKTEIGKALASALDVPLIRLQCYEGLDLAQAAYEWNYTKQLLELRAREVARHSTEGSSENATADDPSDLFDRRFLLSRPLLRAIDARETGGRCVLLIDELDRADEEFEAFLLELLSDFQITIPEIGTLRADERPVVVLTSNRTREIHDALKRRCIYHWIDFPDFEKEVAIVRERAPGASRELTREVVAFVQALRDEDLFKRPGIAETLDWLNALIALDRETLSDDILRDTLGVLLKYQDDLEKIDSPAAKRLLERSRQPVARGA